MTTRAGREQEASTPSCREQEASPGPGQQARPSSMAAPARRLLLAAPGRLAAREAGLGLGFGFGPGGDGTPLPWDVVAARLGELLRVLVSALQALAGGLAALARGAGAAALPAAAAVAALVVACCCCGYCAAAGRRRRGPDGEEVQRAGEYCDGPVVRYRPAAAGGYKGGLFSMHPNKPIVC